MLILLKRKVKLRECVPLQTKEVSLQQHAGQSEHLAGSLHLLESFLLQVSNMLPVMVGPLAMGSHLSSITVWLSMALIITTLTHCGYHLPFLPSPEFHDYHHLK